MSKKPAAKKSVKAPSKAAKPKASTKKSATAKTKSAKVADKPKPESKLTAASAQKAGKLSVDPNTRALARQHRDEYVVIKEKLNKAQREMQGLGKTVKADGLKMSQIKLMVELSTPEGEQAFRFSMQDNLLAAQYQGSAIGNQLDLFMQPDRTPSVDIAKDEGVQDSMDGKVAKPKYDPSTPQHKAYLDGYHAETARRVKEGISEKAPEPESDKVTKLIPKAETDAKIKEAADKAAARSASNGNGAPLTDAMTSRQHFKTARQTADEVFNKPVSTAAH